MCILSSHRNINNPKSKTIFFFRFLPQREMEIFVCYSLNCRAFSALPARLKPLCVPVSQTVVWLTTLSPGSKLGQVQAPVMHGTKPAAPVGGKIYFETTKKVELSR